MEERLMSNKLPRPNIKQQQIHINNKT